MVYSCKNKCSTYKIGGINYVGTNRTEKIEKKYELKYCKKCQVYFDTNENRCLCCGVELRHNSRSKYKKNV